MPTATSCGTWMKAPGYGAWLGASEASPSPRVATRGLKEPAMRTQCVGVLCAAAPILGACGAGLFPGGVLAPAGVDAPKTDACLPGYVPPKGYVCYRASAPIRIDGKLDDPAWRDAPWTDDFVDIEGSAKPKPRFR